MKENNIEFIKEYKFEDCKHKYNLRFDFYLPEYNMCIEYDGIQHFIPFSFGSDQTKINKLNNLEIIQRRDQIKTQYCLDNNIKLLRIPYWKINNIEKILSNYLRSKTCFIKDNYE